MMSLIPMLLFLLSFTLFAYAIFPAVREAVKVKAMSEFDLSGTVWRKSSSPGTNHPVPIAKAEIEIGGFRTQSDSTGHFSLKFASKERAGIAVVIRQRNLERVFRLDYPDNAKTFKSEFVIE